MAKTTKATVKAKKTAPKRKATATKRNTTPRHARKSRAMKSLRVSRTDRPFMTFSFTEQTVYWLIILAMVVGLVAFVLHAESKINAIYDQVDANTSQLELIPENTPAKKPKTHQ